MTRHAALSAIAVAGAASLASPALAAASRKEALPVALASASRKGIAWSPAFLNAPIVVPFHANEPASEPSLSCFPTRKSPNRLANSTQRALRGASVEAEAA